MRFFCTDNRNHLAIMALATGTKAPDFTLPRKTDDGVEEVTLSKHFGKDNVVLLFFPLAFTSVCTEQMCDVSGGLLKDASGLDAVVFGISVDSPFAQEAFAKANKITVPLLSDFNKEVSKQYDVLFEDLLGLRGVAKRSAFVINKEGVIVHADSSDDPKQVPAEDKIKAALQG